ncbi:MAG: hypothetical protein WD906_00900 [Anaerolineales bacterium]
MNWKGDNFLGAHPASQRVIHSAVDLEAHAVFSASIVNLAPEQR